MGRWSSQRSQLGPVRIRPGKGVKNLSQVNGKPFRGFCSKILSDSFLTPYAQQQLHILLALLSK